MPQNDEDEAGCRRISIGRKRRTTTRGSHRLVELERCSVTRPICVLSKYHGRTARSRKSTGSSHESKLPVLADFGQLIWAWLAISMDVTRPATPESIVGRCNHTWM